MTLNMNSSGKAYTYLDDGVSLNTISTGPKLYDDKFHHICQSFDGVNRNIYVDGKLYYKNAFPWTGNTRWPTIGAIIGHDVNNPPVSAFNGVIDDVRIYAGAISEASIRKIFADNYVKYSNWK